MPPDDLVDDPEMVRWIEYVWDLSFQWDEGQRQKVTNNPLNIEEVEALFSEENLVFFAGKSTRPSDEPRFIAYIKTKGRQYFTIGWTPRGTQMRIFGKRGAREYEKRRIESEIEKSRK